MRIETVVLALKKRRDAMAEGVFNTPPTDMQAFARLQGIWQGIGEALNIISEEVRKDHDD